MLRACEAAVEPHGHPTEACFRATAVVEMGRGQGHPQLSICAGLRVAGSGPGAPPSSRASSLQPGWPGLAALTAVTEVRDRAQMGTKPVENQRETITPGPQESSPLLPCSGALREGRGGASSRLVFRSGNRGQHRQGRPAWVCGTTSPPSLKFS